MMFLVVNSSLTTEEWLHVYMVKYLDVVSLVHGCHQ